LSLVDAEGDIVDRGDGLLGVGVEELLAQTADVQRSHRPASTDRTMPQRSTVPLSNGARTSASRAYQSTPSTIMPTNTPVTSPARRASNIMKPIPLVPTMISAAISARQP